MTPRKRRLAVLAAIGGPVVMAAVGTAIVLVLGAEPGGDASAMVPWSEAPPERTVEDEGAPDRPPADVSLPAGVPDDAEVAIVDRVVDGDTIRVIVPPDGSTPGGGSIRVRLLNIDTPERARDGRPAQCGAEAATRRVRELVAPGDLVWLAADEEDRDRFDRLLRAVWTTDGVLVNELLAEEGYAEPLLIPPNDRFHDRVVAAAERAQAAGRGLWGELCP